MLVLESLVGLHRTIQLQLIQHSWSEHRLEHFTLKMKTDPSVVLEILSKYCILDAFVDYYGYSISSKGFFLTVVDIMVI